MGDAVPINRSAVAATDRPLPHALAAETAVAASALQDAEARARVLDVAHADHFGDPALAWIMRAIEALVQERTPVSPETVETWLAGKNQHAIVPRIAALMQAFPDLAAVAAHAEIVVDYHERRQTILTCRRVALEAEGAISDWRGFKLAARRDFERVTAPRSRLVGKTLDVVVDETRAQVVAAQTPHVVGVRYGFAEVESIFGLLARKEQHVLAGRTEMGKTAFAMHVAANVARGIGRPNPETGTLDGKPHPLDAYRVGEAVYVHSAEMPAEALIFRMACSFADVDAMAVKMGIATATQLENLGSWMGILRGLPMIIDDEPAPAVEIARRVSAWQEAFAAGKARRKDGDLFPKCRLQLVIGDHIQTLAKRVSGIDGRADMKEKIAAVSLGWLNNIAKGCDVATLLLSQLNRSVEDSKRQDKWPRKSDLEGAGEIEQDADTILCVHRPEVMYRDASKCPAKWRSVAALVPLKLRGSSIKRVVRLGFDKGYFSDVLPPWALAEPYSQDDES